MVIKRNGTKEEFSFLKIEKVVCKAFEAARLEQPEEWVLKKIYSKLKRRFNYKNDIRIEAISDEIEKVLMNDGFEDVAKAFIIYRYEHKKVRDFAQKKIDFINDYKKSDNNANATIDDNSNINTKNIAVLNTEIHKPDNQIINLKILENKVRELYPDFDYKQLMKDLESVCYLHDSSSQIGMPYCVAISMYPFLNDGLQKLGGLSAAPKNIDSFCGMFCNLVFLIASQFKGACMYKDQTLLIKENGISKKYTSKEFVEKYLINPLKFTNQQGDWECAIINNDVYVQEDGRLVKVNKVYRRKYKDSIYKIATKKGHIAFTTKDHIFKQLLLNRDIDVKASQLQIFDTVYVNYDYSNIINFDSLEYKRGWIIGMLCGDGNLTQENSVRLAVNYKQEFYGDTFNAYSEEVFGNTLNKNKGHNCWSYQKYNQEYYTKIHSDIIGNTAYDKHIIVENKSIDYLAGFLDGLFCADGSYSQSHGITISLTNKELAQNVQDIVNLFGITTNICTVAPRGNRKESYQQYISARILKYLKNVQQKAIVKEKVQNIQDSARELYYYGYNVSDRKAFSNKINSWWAKKEPKRTDVITSIDTFVNDDEYVYEIETESHWYNCGGFITHNCATPSVLLYMDYFCRQEWGDDYYQNLDTVISSPVCKRQMDIHHQIHQYFQQICYTLMQPSGGRGNQSVFWNVSLFDKTFYETMYSDFYFPDGTQPIWESLNWLQKDFMHWLNQERLKTILTFPVVSACLIYQDGKFLDEDLYHFVCKEYSEGNSFFTYISDSADSLSSCCRLSSKLEKPQFNFTNGQLSEMTGSKNVITLDLNRITQDWAKIYIHPEDIQEIWHNSPEEYKKAARISLRNHIVSILDRVYKYQTAYNSLLTELKDAGMLPAYNAGFINMKKQYLTIGINGLNQAAEFLGMKCNKNEDYKEFCNLIFATIKEQNQLHKTNELMFNTEFTPCESAAIKLYDRDKKDGYWVPEDTNLYASYIFKPNDTEISILDKIYLHGKDFCGDNLDGGSAAHLNLEEHLTEAQYEKIISYAAQVGCKYLTFNVPNSECDECGFITKVPIEQCPKCGSKKISYYDRVIGYMTKIANWSKGRQIEQKTRVYQKITEI